MMLLAGLALGIAFLVPFFCLLLQSSTLQPRPLPSTKSGSSTSHLPIECAIWLLVRLFLVPEYDYVIQSIVSRMHIE